MLNINGKLISRNVERFRIKWDAPCRSKIQLATKLFLQPFWLTNICYEEFPVYGTLLKVDIINFTKKIAVEVQGNQHDNYNPFFHGSRAGYFTSIKNDSIKRRWLELNGFQLVEIYEDEVPKISKELFVEKFNIHL